MASTVLTLALDEISQQRFERLRREHFPTALNRIPAHLTLFHTLRFEDDVREVLLERTAMRSEFPVQVRGLMFLGRGVAYAMESEPLLAVHRELATAFQNQLSAQDRQRFRPHVVVQNKVTPAEAKALFAQLEAGFEPWRVRGVGLDWWEYLGGPWQRIEHFPFCLEA